MLPVYARAQKTVIEPARRAIQNTAHSRNGGSTAGDIWLPYLERALTARGHVVINRTFPDHVKARAERAARAPKRMLAP